MTKAVLGIIGGSGIYDLPGLENVREERDREPVGRAVGRAADRRDRRPAGGVPAAPRQGPPAVALRHQLSRQHRRAQARRRHRSGLALGLRLVQGGAAARHLRAGRPVRRPHPQARELVLRQGAGRACLDGASGVAAAAHPSRRRGAGRGHRGRARRHLCLHGGAAVLHAGREPDLQAARLFGDRHDQHAGGQARPRGRDLLRDRRHGDRLRLLASRPRRRHGAGHHQGARPPMPRRPSAWWRGSPAIFRASTSRVRSAPTARSTPR